ncbi:SDR family oxidoreductase [Flavobacterium agricola]|uniref:SDR family oxidoreductase n=1 Tax=Flavobacterium agricola TaxID=2870839 RepID=A0ABY6M1Q8_9FLAO|nr:SDR family oxidoreductase [Flavobacterium agricola]UYW02480.1 SDR family oxidoreductase [Flavobacterium agricola]
MKDSENKNSRRDFMKKAGLASAGIMAAGVPLSAHASEKERKKDQVTKVAVITGAARGIGRATAIDLAKQGVDIWGIDILGKISDFAKYDPATDQDILETKKQVEAIGVKFNYSKADIRDLNRLKEVAEEIKSKYKHIDYLVANAGLQTFSKILDSQTQDWADILDVNVIGTAHSIIAFAPLMIPNKKGKIVIVGSTQGMRGMWNGAAYSASKWAVVGLAKSAAIELGEYNINVNVVVPGLIYTKMSRNLKRMQVAMGPGYENAQVTEKEVEETLRKKDVLGVPWLTAEEVSPVISFLCSDAANKITGAVYDVAAGTSTVYTS